MPKPKKIKLKASERGEIDRLNRALTVARFGVETANELHFAAGEKLWRVIRDLYPNVIMSNANYYQGVVTYTPKEEKL